MTRARGRLDARERRIGGDEAALLRVEAIDEDLVQAEVGGEGELVSASVSIMWPRGPLLPLGIGALCHVLHEGRAGPTLPSAPMGRLATLPPP